MPHILKIFFLHIDCYAGSRMSVDSMFAIGTEAPKKSAYVQGSFYIWSSDSDSHVKLSPHVGLCYQ